MQRSMSGRKRWWLVALCAVAVMVALVLARGCGGEARRAARPVAGTDGGGAGARRAASAIVGEVREVGGAASWGGSRRCAVWSRIARAARCRRRR